MYRFVNESNRDYVGREEERKDMKAAIEFLNEIVLVPKDKSIKSPEVFANI